jgi:arylsulfatase A-like enzyme
LYKGGKKFWHRNDELIHDQGHATDLIADEAISFINEKRGKPFFLYVPFTAVHDPFDEPEQFLKQVEHIGKGRQQYAASAVHMDEAIGRIVDALNQQGGYDNTLLIFMSDNGGTRGENGSNYPGTYPFNNEQGSNRPLRGWKRDVYEGGVRVPALAVWPGKIEPGTKLTHPLHAVDWMPTLSAIAGYKASSDLKWDGRDITALLTGKQNDAELRTLYCVSHTRAAYLRHGNWKLIVDKNRQKKELYNLSDDPEEKKNLASDRPQIVERLLGLLEAQAAKDHDALP